MIPHNPTNLMMCSYQPGVLTSCYSFKPGLLLIEALVDSWDFQIHQESVSPTRCCGCCFGHWTARTSFEDFIQKRRITGHFGETKWYEMKKSMKKRLKRWQQQNYCLGCRASLHHIFRNHSIQWGFPQSWMHQSRCFVDGPCVFIFSCLCGCFAGGAVCIVFFQRLSV